MSVRRVGCVGLGAMGGPIAANLLKTGFHVTVFDVRPAAAVDLVAAGADAAASVPEAARDADVLSITVLNDDQLRAVVLGTGEDDGALASLRPGAVVLVHSTVTPQLCSELAGRLREHGVGFVDAPISGGLQAAIDGTLTLMVGGERQHVDDCRPVFDAVGATWFHLGGPGAGQLGKLVNNLMGIATRVVVREGLELARAAGLDDDVVLRFVEQSSGNSWQVTNWRAMQEAGRRAVGGPAGMAAIAQKDLDLALHVAAAYGLELPVTAAASRNVAGMFGDHG